MTSPVFVRPPFREEWTGLESNGEYEDQVMNICIAALMAADWEICVQEDGEMIPYDEFEHED